VDILEFQRAVFHSARPFRDRLAKDFFEIKKGSEAIDGRESDVVVLRFRHAVELPLEFPTAVANRVETGADPGWRLVSLDMSFEPDRAGPQWNGRLRELKFSRLRSTDPTDTPTPRVPTGPALAQLQATVVAVAEKLGPSVWRPSSLRIRTGGDHQGLVLDLAFDVVGEHYRQSYSTLVSSFEKAAAAKESAFARVRADPRERQRADGVGATYTLAIELRDRASSPRTDR
jgi:hypothetical protein